MKKLQQVVLSFCLVLGLLWYPNMEVHAASVTLGVSASQVDIGDTVTVSVTVPEEVSATVDLSFSSSVLSFVSASADVNANGSTIRMNIGKYSLAGTRKINVTFKASTSGSANISASVVSAVDNDTADEVSLDGASTVITVANQVQKEPETTPTDTESSNDSQEQPKSPDNSLSSLKLSSGTLSPSFQYSVTKYTAVVEYHVNHVVVSAAASNSKATIESVTGNGNVDLQVGENTIQVVVKAENGVKATYTIVVTRLAENAGQTADSEDEPKDEPKDEPESESESESEGESESESENDSEGTTETESVFLWNGKELKPEETIPNEVIPVDFALDTISINAVEFSCLTFANADLKLLYLTDEEGSKGLYVYDEQQKLVYSFVKIESENGYIIVLLPDEENVPDAEKFKECTLSIKEKGIVNAYQFIENIQETQSGASLGLETFYAAESVTKDFYLLYAMNDAGTKGWYIYDSIEGTYQRYVDTRFTSDAETDETIEDTENAQKEENEEENEKLLNELAKARNMQMILICVSVFVGIVLVIIIINLIIRNRSNEEGDEEYDIADGIEEESVNEIPEEVIEEDEAEVEFYEVPEEISDEVEVEFYEMPEEISDEVEVEFYEMPEEVSDEVTEDDEVEVEFYEMSEETKDSKEEAEFCNMEDILVKEAAAFEEEFFETEKEISTQNHQEVSENKNHDTLEEDDDDLEFIELD